MGEKVSINDTNEIETINDENELIELTEGLLMDARASINSNKTVKCSYCRIVCIGSRNIIINPSL